MIVIQEKEKDLPVVLRKKMKKIILMTKHYIHLMMKIDVDGHPTHDIEFKKPCSVNLGDNRSLLAYGKGTYHVKADVESHTQKISLQEVLYLLELEKNLLSVHAMVKRGATVTFRDNKCEISRNSKILAMGEINGKLYT